MSPSSLLISNWPIYPSSDSGLREFLIFWFGCYAGLLVLYFGVGALLHWVNTRRPDRRIQTRPMKNQVAMEIGQSVKSLALIAALVAGGHFCQAKGWALAPWPTTWWSLPLLAVVSLVLYDAWFYWGHRLMHTERLYRFHAHHHKSIVPTPWSNNSDTMVGAFVEQAYFLVVPFFLPLSPELLAAHKIFDQITGMVGHAGHEYFASPSARRPWPLLCTTFHDQHHGYFRYNYANTFSWWDRWMGTIHPSYDTTVQRFETMSTAPPGGTGGASSA
jgi:sterol desaturase/sphingolipid hydroxylase (fatty acid hydroxylase superfamily)